MSCVALFIDLSKAFNTVDHHLLLQRLQSIGFSITVLNWFSNYLSGRTQCVALDNCTSSMLEVKMGVPQESVLGPILFSIYINNLGLDLNQTKANFYADDTILYTSATSLKAAIHHLQLAFSQVQKSLVGLKLVLNAKKTKLMFFTRSHSLIDFTISTQSGTPIERERVTSYKYLGIWFDDRLSFGVHIESLLKKLRPKLDFYFRLKKCFPYSARKRLVQSTFLSVLDYRDLIYMHSTSFLFKKN